MQIPAHHKHKRVLLVASKKHPNNSTGVMNILGTVVLKECILLTETVFEDNRQRHGWRGSFESARKATRVSQPPPA